MTLFAMTSRVGSEEYIYILDERSERLMIYRAARNSIELLDTSTLPRVFSDARSAAGRD